MKKFVAIASSIASFALFAASASAHTIHYPFPIQSQSSDIVVNNNNNASVSNTVSTYSSTGSNTSVGGAAKSYAHGNSATSEANGGDGNDVTSGAAGSYALVENGVNSNTTTVNADCGCKGDITVNNTNHTVLYNTVSTSASTGSNNSTGAKARSGASATKSFSFFHHTTGGSATSEANGGDGGDVASGDAYSESHVVNVLNSNVTRIVR